MDATIDSTVDDIYACPIHHVSLGMCCGKGSVVGYIETRKDGENDVQD